jgi:hypothetical protein
VISETAFTLIISTISNPVGTWKMDSFISFIISLVNLVIFRRGKQKPAHPTLRFHDKRGPHIDLLANQCIAVRTQGFEDGIVFSQKPIRIYQPVSIQILETAPHTGPLHIGFTSMNPERISRGNMYTEKTRDWAERKNVMWMRGLFVQDLKQNSVVSFYVNFDGEVIITVDGSEHEVLFRLGDPSRPLWAVFDIYGSIRSIKLVDVAVEIPDAENNNESYSQQRPRRSSRIQQRDQEVPIFNFPDAPFPVDNSSASNSSNHFLAPLTPNNSGILSPAFGTPSSPGVFSMKECIICMNDEADTAFIKCGHLCMCNFCAEDYMRQTIAGATKCPVCRAPVTGLLKTFIS